ncbi:single-stranded DNA binding protein [Escherichia phage IsaakIselin]|uniref:Single-stranded DNA binding protein n=1 Tax=Escherichia phage IsaakIselin TaxID=2851974 RepID=A0AAE8B6V4_9CAUD|nr:single-stranded DNA binding protein [Escherichia phage IsaakIselin]
MHVITGEIRKEPRIKETANGKLYVVELSERFKDREGQWQYTNYTFFFNAKTDGMRGWYDEAFQQGKVISVSCETLKAEMREYNGNTYVTLQAADFPKLLFSQRGEGGAPQQQSQPRQQQTQQQPRQNNEPPIDFDDDIPF